MMRKFLIGGLLAAASIPVLAQTAPAPPVVVAPPIAQVAPVPPAPPVARVAPMADHVMTRAEVQAMVQAHFARMDTNHDGSIAGDEMKPRGEWKREGGPGRHDMMIRREGPMQHDPAEAFNRIDTNKDGMISRDEFAKGHQMRVEKRVMMDGPARAGAAKRFRMHRMGGMMGGKMIKMADTNKDGRITLQEATATALQHFDSADTNRDGRLTPDEMRSRHQRMRTEMHKAG